MNLTDAQKEQLLRPINPRRVGKDGKGFAHLEAYDIRAHLSRIFGIGGWSCAVEAMELVFETASEGDKPRWTVCYRAKVELRIHPSIADGCLYTEWATGDATNMPSRADAHDMAIKTAESQALKRCAVNLGDQFGLSLYAKGSTAAVVKAVIPWAVEPVEVEHEVVPESLERGMPPKDVQTNVVATSDPWGNEEQDKAVAAILAALEQRDGEQARAYLSRVTKAQVDVNRYGLAEHEVNGEPLSVIVGNALADATASMS